MGLGSNVHEHFEAVIFGELHGEPSGLRVPDARVSPGLPTPADHPGLRVGQSAPQPSHRETQYPEIRGSGSPPSSGTTIAIHFNILQ